MEIRRYPDVHAFASHVEPFLTEHEAEHNLMLGITTQLRHSAIQSEGVLYLASALESGRVTAVALRTPPHNVVVSRGPDAAIEPLAGDLRGVYPELPGVLGPKRESRRFAEAWRPLSGQAFSPGVAQRIYQLDRVAPVTGVPGRMRPATEDDHEWLSLWSQAFLIETRDSNSTIEQARRTIGGYLTSDTRGMYVWEADGRPVSIAGYAGPTPNGIRVSHVYTPPELRGRGYASACVAALSQHLLDSGYRHCFLYTDLSNPTSNRIYQRIGYTPVADVDEWVFVEPVATSSPRH